MVVDCHDCLAHEATPSVMRLADASRAGPDDEPCWPSALGATPTVGQSATSQATSNTWATSCRSILDPENCRTTDVIDREATDFSRLRTSSMTKSFRVETLTSCCNRTLRRTQARSTPRLQAIPRYQPFQKSVIVCNIVQGV